MTDNDLLITRAYVVALCDDNLLRAEADKMSTSKSAMLRRIIREWDDWRRRRMVDTPADYITARVPDGGR